MGEKRKYEGETSNANFEIIDNRSELLSSRDISSFRKNINEKGDQGTNCNAEENEG